MKSFLVLFCLLLSYAIKPTSFLVMANDVRTIGDVELINLCTEQRNCMNILTSNVGKLGNDVIKVINKLKQQSPHSFNLSDVNDIENFKRDLKRQIEYCHATNIKLRLLRDQDPEINDHDRKEGKYGVGSWIADSLINLTYWDWKSTKGKREFLENKIKDSTHDVPILKKYLSDKEIEVAISEIAQTNLIDSDLLKNKFQLVKEAYKKFTQKIMQKVLQDNCLPTTHQNVQDLTNDFNICINRSISERNIDICLNKFQQSIGHRVGVKILDSILQQEFAHLKPIEFSNKKEWIGKLKNAAIANYNQCVDKWFFKERRDDPNDIQSCAYQGVAAAFSITAQYKVNDALRKSVSSEAQRQQIVTETMQEYQCPIATQLRQHEFWDDRIYDNFKHYSSDEFKNSLDKCVDSLTIIAGRKATRLVLANHSALANKFNNRQEKEKFINNLLDKDYGKCIASQKKEIAILGRKHPMTIRKCSTEGTKYSIDPSLCQETLTASTTMSLVESGIYKKIDNYLATTLKNWNPKQQKQLHANIKAILDACRKQVNSDVEQNIHYAFWKKEDGGTLKNWEKPYLQCVAGAIGLLSYEVAVPVMQDELKQNSSTKDYDIKLSGAEEEQFKKAVSDCYSKRVGGLKKVEELSTQLDDIASICALEGKKVVMPFVLPKVLDQTLVQYIKNPKERKSVIEEILRSDSKIDHNFTWRTIFSKAKSNSDIDKFIKAFTVDTTAKVFSILLVKNLDTYYPVSDKKHGLRNKRIQQQFLKKYINRDFERSLFRATAAEQDAILETAQLHVANDIVLMVLRDNVNENIKDEKVRDKLLKRFKGDFSSCINRKIAQHIVSSVAIDQCSRKLKISAYKEIGFRVMRDKIYENISNKTEANICLGSVKKKLESCIDKANDKKGEEFDKHLDGCLSVGALKVARKIGDFTILSYAPILTPGLSQEKLRDYISNRHSSQKTKNKIDDKNMTLMAYSSFDVCINQVQDKLIKSAKQGRTRVARVVYKNVEAALVKSNIRIKQSADMIDKCGKQFEHNIILGLKKSFISYKYPNKFPDHNKNLADTFDMMMLLRGKKSKDNNDASETPEGTWKQLKMIGERTVLACNYDKVRCDYYIKQTTAKLKKYRKEHPDATSQELMDLFYNSEYMKFIVRASVADVVKKELTSGLTKYFDKDGILQKKIDIITGSSVMEKALQGKAGRMVVRLAIEAIKQGNVDTLGSNKQVRKNLTQALVVETDEFVDELLYGLVQPKLLAEVRHPSLSTKIGYALGIVKEGDMDWQKVRHTKYGKKARNYFQHELVMPLFNGENISDKEMKSRAKKLEKKIVKAVKKAS